MATNGQNAGTLGLREPDWLRRPVSGTELAKGMLLLRASNMNVIRLQLAMERSDRRIAMEALDGLVAIDREIRGFIGELPPPDAAYSAMARRIDDQKTVIASEKLIFAAGKRGPAIAPGRELRAETPPPAAPAPALAAEMCMEPTCWAPEEEPARAAPWGPLLAAFLVVALAAAAAFFLFGPDVLLARLAALAGALQ